MINSGTSRIEKKYAKVEGSGGQQGRHVTLADLEGFLAAAKAEGIPGDTLIEAPGVFATVWLYYLQVGATIEAEAV